MAQTKKGATLIAVKKIGISLREYNRLVSIGLKRCSYCKIWLDRKLFNSDVTRHDRLSPVCKNCRKKQYRMKYVPKKRVSRLGCRYVIVRDGDKLQARARINHLIDVGLLPKPNDLPCIDCGHLWKIGERRHEYDHYNGFEGKYHETVEVVCSRCHHKREVKKNNE